jgi:GAF domain-containing protein/DNA-binding response OmpR family regulator
MNMPIKQSLSQLENLFSGVSEPDIPEEPRARPRRPAESASTPSGWVWEFDSDGNCLWCSDEILPLLGIRPSQLRGQALEFSGLLPDSVHRLRAALAGGDPIDNLFLSANHRNGSPIMLLLNALPRMDEEGQPSTYRAVVQVLQSAPAKTRKAAPAPKVEHATAVAPAKRPALRPAETPEAVAPISPARRPAVKSSAAQAPVKAEALPGIPGAQKIAPLSASRKHAAAVTAETTTAPRQIAGAVPLAPPVKRAIKPPMPAVGLPRAEVVPVAVSGKHAIKPSAPAMGLPKSEAAPIVPAKRHPAPAAGVKEIPPYEVVAPVKRAVRAAAPTVAPVRPEPAAPIQKRTPKPQTVTAALAAIQTPTAPTKKRTIKPFLPEEAPAAETPKPAGFKRITKPFVPAEEASGMEAPKAAGKKRITKPFVPAQAAASAETPKRITQPFATTEARAYIETPARTVKKRITKPIPAEVRPAPAAEAPAAPKKRITDRFIPIGPAAMEPPTAPKKRITRPFPQSGMSELPPAEAATKPVVPPPQKPRVVPTITSILRSAAESAPEKRIHRPTLEELLPTIAPSLRKVSEIEEPAEPVEAETEASVSIPEPTIPSPVIDPMMPTFESPAFAPAARVEIAAMESPKQTVPSTAPIHPEADVPPIPPSVMAPEAAAVQPASVLETPEKNQDEFKPGTTILTQPTVISVIPSREIPTEPVRSEPSPATFVPESLGTRKLSPLTDMGTFPVSAPELASAELPKAEPPAQPSVEKAIADALTAAQAIIAPTPITEPRVSTPETPAPAILARPEPVAPVMAQPTAPAPRPPSPLVPSFRATGPLSLTRAFGGGSQSSSPLSVQPILFHDDPSGLQRLDYYNSPETQKALSSGELVISQPGGDGNGDNRSVMAVPIRLQDQVLGVLEFRDDSAMRHWSDEDRMLAEEITDQLALALENARLFHQAAARTQELALVNRVVSSVAGSLDLLTSLDSVASELAKALSLGHASISLLSEDKSTLTLVSDQPGRLDRSNPTIFVPVNDAPILQKAVVERGPTIFTGLSENPLRPLLPGEKHEHRTRSMVLIPLIAEGNTIGLVGLHLLEEGRSFTADELRLAETIVAQASTAIQNARLHNQTEEALHEAVNLFQTSQRLQKAVGEEQLMQETLDSCKTAVPLNSISIQLFGEETGQTYVQQVAHLADAEQPSVEDGTRFPGVLYPFYDLLQSGQTIISNHAEDDDRLSGMVRPILADLAIASIVAVPLRVRGENIGILQAVRRVANPFSHTEERFLETVGAQLSVALDNYRLLNQTQRRAQQLEIAAEVSRLATSTLETGTLLSRAVNLLRERFGFYHTAVYLLDDQGKYAVVREATGQPGLQMKESKHSIAVGSRTIIGQVTENGKPYAALDTSKDPYYRADPNLPETRTQLALPLKIGDRMLGALDIHVNRANAFSPADVSVLQSLADQVAVALDNARSYEVEREALKEMREADRLKTQFLANMSHELRTPLNSIIGFSRVILKGIDGPITDLQNQDLTAIHNAGQHLLGLINDILDISRIDAGKMELAFEEVDMRNLIQSVASTALGLIKDKPIRLTQYIPDDLPLARADPIRARQVLLNLLSNAAKFTEAGSIVIEAKLQTSPDNFPEIVISVSDTGSGIPADHFPKLFQEFSQVDASPTRRTGGTGLGLSICKRLVEMHGGRIWVDSILGKGSTFYFTVPALQPKAAPASETAPAVQAPVGRKNVMVVENETGVVQLYRRYLEPRGYTIVELSDGARAVPMARELRPYAILLDVNMPSPDGWQVLAQLKSDPVTRPLPVILCTITEDRGRGLSLGAADYLVKPILESDLIASLEKLEKPERKAFNILVLEDNPEEAQLVQHILEKLSGFAIRMVAEGGTGLEMIEAEPPALIIVDLELPGTMALDVIRTLRSKEKTKLLPIIALTQTDPPPDQREQLAGLVQAILRKAQFSEHDLMESIARALKLYEHKGVPGTSPLSLERKPSTSPLPGERKSPTAPLSAEKKPSTTPLPVGKST